MASKQFNSVDGYSVGNSASSVIDANSNVSGNVITATANVTAPQLVSNVATGTAPLVVTSTTKVANLNVDLLDGFDTSTSATANTVVVRDTSGNISANFFIGNGSQLTGVTGTAGNSIVNGTSNVVVDSSGNVRISVAGTANVMVVSSTAVTAPAFTASSGVFTGNGSGLSAIAGANVTGTVSSATTAGTVTTNAQPNITSVGTLTSLTTSGNTFLATSSGNVGINTTNPFAALVVGGSQAGNAGLEVIPGSGVVLQGYNRSTSAYTSLNLDGATIGFRPNGSTRLTVDASGANVTGTLGVSGNANVGNLGTAQVLASANVTAPRLISNVADGTAPLIVTSTTLVPNLYVARANVADNISVVAGTGNNFLIFANAATGNISELTSTGLIANLSNNSITATTFVGSLSGAATTAGTVTTAAQPNITSVGTLTSLNSSGTITAPAFTANTGVFTGNGSALTALNASNVSSGTLAQARLANSNVVLGSTALTLGSTVTTVAGLSSVTSTTFVGALTGAATTAATVTTAAQPNITSVGTLTSLNSSGTITAPAFTANTGVFTGNGSGLSAIAGANVTGTVSSATTAGTVTTAAQGNITSLGTLTGLGVNGTITGVNITANTGVFTGNGAALTNLNASNVSSGTLAQARLANSNVVLGSTTLALGSTTTTIAGLSSVTSTTFVGALTGAATTAATVTTAAQPNITSVGTLASVAVTGNVAAGNLTTTGVLSVTGTGVSSIAGNLDMTSNTIINLAMPTNPNDAASKQYVDDIAQGLHTHDSCNAATNTTLATISSGTVTYNNGTSGVGATLTTTGTYTTIDGVTLSNGMRILVKNEANAAHNGIYDRTSTTVLTRSTDFDTPAEMAGGDFTFITAGTLYDNTGWVMTDPVTTVGTTAVNWVQFSGAGTYTAGTGLTLTGSVFSVNASQTQITSVGTLTGLGVNGTITGVNITANTGVFTGNGSALTALNASNVSSGTLAQARLANSNVVLGSTTLALGSTTTTIAGLSSVTSTTFVGALTGAATTAATVTTAAQPNITSVGTLTSLNSSGTITAPAFTANTGVFTGNGSALTALNGSNITTGTVAAARVATLNQNTTGSAATVTTNAQPNITSVGTLTSLTVSGNAFLATSSGNVGIGTTTPRGNLDVSTGSDGTTQTRSIHLGYSGLDFYGFRLTNVNTPGSFAAGNFSIQRGTTSAWVDDVVINNSGAVGIGTTSPAYKLDVVGSAFIGQHSNNATNASLAISGGGTSSNSVINLGYYSTFDASIWNIMRVGSDQSFRISNFGSGSEVVAISATGAGNVGIGTTSAGHKLEVAGQAKVGTGAASAGQPLMVNTPSGTSAGIQLFQDSVESWVVTNPASSTRLAFAASGNERMTINSDGNVGIGTTTPSIKLDVVGGNNDGLQYRTSTRTVGIGMQAGEAAIFWGSGTRLNFTSGGAIPLTIAATTGNVGIGTTSPGSILGVNGTVTAAAFTANTGVFTGNGSGLSAIAGANVTGTVANATFATSAGTVTNGVYTTDNVVIARSTVISTNTSDFNTFTTAGTYQVSGNGTWTGSTNGPTNAYSYGQLIVTTNGTIVTQVYYSHSVTGNFVRNKFNASDWTAWQEELTSTNYNEFAPTLTGSGASGSWGISVTGSAGTATTAATVTTAAQPNITSVGTLTSLNSSGTITAPAFTANTGVFTGNGSGISAINGSNITTGTVAAARVATLNQNTTGSAATVTTNAQPNITSVGTLTSLNSSGTITAPAFTANTGVFTGNGSALTALNGSNITTGTVAAARVATLNQNTTGSAATVTTNAQPNITSVGTLSALTVSGNAFLSTSSGNVGIGTSSPASKIQLSYSNPVSVPAAGAGGHAIAAGAAGYGFTTGALTSGKVYIQSTRWDGSATNYDLLLQPNGSNVGIGTTTPTVRLDVAGDIKVKSNIAYVSPNGANTINSTMLNGGTLAWSGNAGQLFSIADNMTGNIFTVNDVSGIPLISVDSGGNIQFAASGGFVSYGVTAGITAAGSTQGTATALTRPINVVSTVSASTGVILPTVPAGTRIIVMNTSGTALSVYPPSGAVINSAATNVAYSQPAGARLEFISVSATQWYTMNATYG